MTDATEPTEVLGRRISGTITRPTSTQVDQKSGRYFLPLLDAVLAIPTVEAVRWQQYTPYWNDGEPCLFSVYDPHVKLAGQDEGGDEEDGWLDGYDLTDYNGPTKVAKPGNEALHPVFDQFGREMDHFEVFLHETFGDHATVTATREGFDVEFYEHD